MSASVRNCSHPSNCHARFAWQCDNCDRWFCDDHGTVGGDREQPGYAAVAYPSVCWACGGFNADE